MACDLGMCGFIADLDTSSILLQKFSCHFEGKVNRHRLLVDIRRTAYDEVMRYPLIEIL